MTNADPIPSTERRIEQATDAIRSMSQDLATEVTPPTWSERVSALTREAPIQSLAIAFLLGVIVSRPNRCVIVVPAKELGHGARSPVSWVPDNRSFSRVAKCHCSGFFHLS